ncbi:Swarming motility regulation protein rssB [Aedoeadaptatus ivorii]|uniref:Swarming motility regulation protein rssB n=1 Tax=Aedoeadaptatus ivorii TaxID=54006 RepID=A0A3S4YJY1_9FIRM|nr:response regulator transcription factor [Peptoniphilus ivorii]VEJ34533.1 Swarming motility regulation protein rssB [Peptoniphilus ivorii]
MRILLLEDDAVIAFSVRRFFENAGHAVDRFETMADCADADPDAYDVVLLDLNLPDGTGFEFLAYLDAIGAAVPVLVLSVRDREADILAAFDKGADDYITKPFSLPVLAARVRNVCHRAGGAPTAVAAGGLTLYPENKSVRIDGENAALNAAEYDLLEALLQNRGICMLRSRLLDEIWRENRRPVNDNTLTVTVKRLREKLGHYGRHIHTERGLGYRWEDEDV